MIKSWEELGEILAEFENRISCLENSIHSHVSDEKPEIPQVSKKAFDELNTRVNSLWNRIHESKDVRAPF